MDNKNEIIGGIALVLVVLTLFVVAAAVVHAILSLIPIFLVAGVAGGLLYWKSRS